LGSLASGSKYSELAGISQQGAFMRARDHIVRDFVSMKGLITVRSLKLSLSDNLGINISVYRIKLILKDCLGYKYKVVRNSEPYANSARNIKQRAAFAIHMIEVLKE
jgi:hypothetical protein